MTSRWTMMSGGAGGDGAAVMEKTAFDLKLTGFDTKSKIKVIARK